MRRIIIGLSAVTLLAGCGWSQQCDKSRSYELETEMTVTVGSPLVQSGCLSEREDPGILKQIIGKKSHYHDNFRPRVEQELIYSGREGNTLHITYREYTYDGLARSPFFQQLFYDVSKSDSIVFQNWVLNVLESSNERIKFKVVKEPLRPEVPPPVL